MFFIVLQVLGMGWSGVVGVVFCVFEVSGAALGSLGRHLVALGCPRGSLGGPRSICLWIWRVVWRAWAVVV